MLRIIVELVPFGDESKKKEIACAKIWNDGTMDEDNSEEWGNYEARIMEGEVNSQAIMYSKKVKNHKRNQSVWCLIRAVLENIKFQ